MLLNRQTGNFRPSDTGGRRGNVLDMITCPLCPETATRGGGGSRSAAEGRASAGGEGSEGRRRVEPAGGDEVNTADQDSVADPEKSADQGPGQKAAQVGCPGGRCAGWHAVRGHELPSSQGPETTFLH